jgi:hypothetical protein
MTAEKICLLAVLRGLKMIVAGLEVYAISLDEFEPAQPRVNPVPPSGRTGESNGSPETTPKGNHDTSRTFRAT